MVFSHKDRADRRRRIANLVREGKTPDTVARLHGVSESTVRNACMEHDVPMPQRPAGGHVPTSAFHVLRRLLDGRTPEEIHSELRCGRWRIEKIRAAAVAAGFNGLSDYEAMEKRDD